MALRCPDCGNEVRGEAVDVAADSATCPHCDASFQPSRALPPAGPEAAREPAASDAPPPEVAYVERTPDGGINVLLPRRGMGGRAAFFFSFATFWNLITLVVSIPFLFAIFRGEMPWPLIFFLALFWVIGLGMLRWACWLAWGETALRLGPEGLGRIRKLFGRSRSRRFPLEAVEEFTHSVAYKQNDVPVYACTIHAGKKKLNFAHKLSDANQKWLVAELNRALRELKPGE